MKNTFCLLGGLATLTLASTSLNAQVYNALDFSGSRTAIINSGVVVGYSFSNVYGNGSDAIMDVVWNKAQSTNSGYFAAGVNDNPTSPAPSPAVGEILVGNGSSQLPTATTSSPKSLAIYLRPYTAVPFQSSSVNIRFDFTLRDSAGTPLYNPNPYKFVTRDLDGQSNSSQKTRESITLIGASNINVVDPSFVTVNGNKLTGNSVNINPTNGNTQGTASWDFYNSSFSIDLGVDYSGNSGNFGNKPGDRGYVFDVTAVAIPEPSSTALLGLGAFGLLLRRRR